MLFLGGRCSLIRLLVVMSVVVVLVLLFISFPVDGVELGRCSCPLVLCSLLLLSVLDWLHLVQLVFVRRLPVSSCSGEWASVDHCNMYGV